MATAVKLAPSANHANPRSDFLGKPFLNRPADSLRCLPVSAVRPILYANLQSDNTKFLYFVPFCFIRRRTAVSCFSSIDRLQLVCFARGAACPPCIPLAKLNQLDHSRLRRMTAHFRGKTYKMHAYEIFEKTFDSNWKGVIWRN